MALPELPAGSEFEVEDELLVQHFVAHSGMLRNLGPEVVPIVLIDVEGLIADGSRSLRMIIPEPLAVSVRDAIDVCLAQLANLRRPPE